MSLSLLIWLPLVISIAALWLPTRDIGRFMTLASLLPLGVAVDVMVRFKPGQTGLQFMTNKVWIGALGIHYKLGVNGLNVTLILLTTVLFTASLAWSAAREVPRTRMYYLAFGLAESAVLGAFLAQDLILFVGFFDLMLLPFYFLVGIWGSGDRVRAALKMFIYTAVGSFLMLAGAVATGVIAASDHNTALNFTFSAIQQLGLPKSTQYWIFLCFAAAFLVKMPLAPFHGWLADAYKSMPIPAVAVFSGLLSKVAAYGFLQIVLPIFPAASHHYQLLMLVISVVSILWATAMAFTTRDARLVIAYSSVAQLSFITLGIFSLRSQGAQGAVLQMLNHGVVTAASFFIVAAVAARTGGSENLDDMGGVAFRAPVLATMFLIVTLANLAMPGSSNFVGEFLVLLGTFDAKLPIAILASVGVIGAAFYGLRLFITSMHNRVGQKVASREIKLTEAIAIVPLVLIIVVLAFYPQFGLRKSQTSVTHTETAVTQGTLAAQLATEFHPKSTLAAALASTNNSQ